MSDNSLGQKSELETLTVQLLSNYSEIDAEVQQLQAKHEEAMKRRSAAVKEIAEKLGTKQAFSFNGKYLGKVVGRPTKGGITYFFRGVGQDIINV